MMKTNGSLLSPFFFFFFFFFFFILPSGAEILGNWLVDPTRWQQRADIKLQLLMPLLYVAQTTFQIIISSHN